MNWLSYQDFFSMGGYGLYVWGSFFTFFAVIAIEILSVYARNRAALKSHCAKQKLSPQRALAQDQAFERVIAASAEKSRASAFHHAILIETHASEMR